MKKSVWVLGLVILLSSASNARADPIQVLYFERLALGLIQPKAGGNFLADEAFNRVFPADFDADRGTVDASIRETTAAGSLFAGATLTSQFSVSERAFSGAGTAFNSVSAESAGFAQGFTEFFTDFTLTALQRFTFEGSFQTTGATTLWNMDLIGNEGRVRLGLQGNDTRAVTASQLLSPGRYGLRVQTSGVNSATAFGSARVDHSFRIAFADPQVAPTPEPGSLLLMGTGVAALLTRYSRRSGRPESRK